MSVVAFINGNCIDVVGDVFNLFNDFILYLLDFTGFYVFRVLLVK